MAFKTGTFRADTLNGTAASDQLSGLGGNDVMHGLGARDKLFGGDGNDRLWGDAGNDLINGDRGVDTMDGGDGNDELFGALGADILYGRAGDDWLEGGVPGGLADKSDGVADRLYGGVGNDMFAAQDASRDTLYGEAGSDTFFAGNDVIYAGAGDDNVNLMSFRDVPSGDDNDVTLGTGTDVVSILMTGRVPHSTVIRDFGATDFVSVSARGTGDYAGPTELFAAMDANGDGLVTKTDNGARDTMGVHVSVNVGANGTVLGFNGDTLELSHVSALSEWQWQ